MQAHGLLAWKACVVVTLASALSARPSPEASALPIRAPELLFPSAGEGRGGEVDPGPQGFTREAGGPWGCPAPGLVLGAGSSPSSGPQNPSLVVLAPPPY